MKRIISALLMVSMILLLFACGEQTQTMPSTTETTALAEESNEKESRTVKVGVSIYDFNDSFMALYKNELERYFATKNNDRVNYEVVVQDGKNDQVEQTKQIENFITEEYDVIILNLVQTTSAASVIDKCRAAGIPVIFINREPSEADMNAGNTGDYAGKLTYVGSDARQSGRFQGEIIAELPDKGDINGDGRLQYVMIEGELGSPEAQYRTEFSISHYKERTGNKVERVDDQVANWKRSESEKLTATALEKHGNKIEVVFCNNDDMAMGAKTAIEAAGRVINENIYLVGADAIAPTIDAVLAGNMTGTVFNDHDGQAHAAVDCAVSAADGEALDLYNWVDYVKITQDNASLYK